MDPNEALTEALADLHESNSSDMVVASAARESAIEHLRDLADWLENGGFAPNVPWVIDEVAADLEAAAEPEEEDDGPPF